MQALQWRLQLWWRVQSKPEFMELGISEAFDLAIERFEKGDLKEARLIGEKIIEADQNSAGAYNLLGLIALENKEFSQAHVLFSRAIAINPNAPDYYNNLGDALCSAHLISEAITQFQVGVQLAPDRIAIRYSLAMALRAIGQYDEAISHFSEIASLCPNAVTLSNLGSMLCEVDRNETAIEKFEEVLKFDPASVVVHSNLASAWRALGEPEKATMEYSSALSL